MSAERSRRVFLDCEFLNLPWASNAGLLWIGLADNDGNTWSAINQDADLRDASQFVLDVVVPQMAADERRLSPTAMRDEVIQFCGDVDEFWAWCPTVEGLVTAFGRSPTEAASEHAAYWDFDFQLLRRTIGVWPSGWPNELRDLNVLAKRSGVPLPVNDHAHHPCHDALWGRRVFELAVDVLGEDCI